MGKKFQIEIYTDGACKGNPGSGGWAARLIHVPSQKICDISGSESNTTNNRMELTAAIEGLRKLNRPNVKAVVYSDSKYLVDGITKWSFNWIASNWMTAANKPVQNKDLWLELIELNAKHEITWKYVKGHAGIEHNEVVDKLASLAATNICRINI